MGDVDFRVGLLDVEALHRHLPSELNEPYFAWNVLRFRRPAPINAALKSRIQVVSHRGSSPSCSHSPLRI